MTGADRSKVAYVALVHKNPGQVARLVRRLATDRARFLVHVDRRAEPATDAAIRRGTCGLGHVAFIERQRCFWGGFGMVGATLAAFEALERREVPFDHVVLVSGQDYPLRPAEEIERFLGNAVGRSFMTASRLSDVWPDVGAARVERWHLVSRYALHLPVPWTRRIPGGLVPFGGGAWVCLSRPVVEHVNDFVRRNPAFVRFFHHVLHPDELFFQTIVMNSPLRETIVQEHLRYIDWSTDPGPAVLRAADFGALVSSDSLFARKFDETVDPTILDLLDHHIETETVASAR